MELSIRMRSAIRSTFDAIFESLREEVSATSTEKTNLVASFNLLEEKMYELRQFDADILRKMAEIGTDSLEDEISTADEYRHKFFWIKSQVFGKMGSGTSFPDAEVHGNVLESPERTAGNAGAQSFRVQQRASRQRNFKLPKLELRKFGGDLKDWVQFWSQFQKIDEDEGIAAEDKYQYLIQATIEKSKAREIVESFPPTAANYPKAIEALKSRFGRYDLQAQIYVRELLKLLLTRSSVSSDRSALLSLYDRLVCYLRALESLDINSEKCACILYPLVESCVPEESLRAWQRKTPFSGDETPGVQLEGLLNFLRTEVEAEERIKLAAS